MIKFEIIERSKRMKINYHFTLLIIFALLSVKTESKSVKSSKPNIIIIYTDDQGYGDVSYLNPNAKFQTPNMDRLAEEGICFTHGHSSESVCTPSRYSLLTGRYSWRTSLKRGVFGSEKPCLIKDGRMTIPSLLKENGYNTAMVGKWHLGMDFPGVHKNRDWSKPTRDMPLDKGFDYFYGIPASMNFGVVAWFEGRYTKVPPTLYTTKKPNDRHVDFRVEPPYQKSPEGITGYVINEIAPDFIDNLCLTRFTDKALEWMESKTADAKSGKPFFVYLPYTSPHYPVCPLPEFYGKGNCGGYGEFVIETDYHIGRILEFLEKSGLDENTMVIFSSDNGPERSWAERIDDYGHHSNLIYREGKRSIYEGGHRVPFLVRWPNGIKKPGRNFDGAVGQVDLLASLAEIIGAELPDNAGEDSQSFAHVLRNPKSKFQRLPLMQQAGNGNYSITHGNWKLILFSDKTKELYNLRKDPSEKNNLAKANPGKVKELMQKAKDIVLKGRTTKGKMQPNDTAYWDNLTWISEEEYVAKQSKLNQQEN